MDSYQWIGLFLAISGFMFAFYKWMVTRGDKRRGDLKTAHDQVLSEHAARLDRHSQRLSKLDELIGLTRDEMLKNHPRIQHIEKLEANIDLKLDRVHKKLGGIARDLNQTIGSMETSRQNDMKDLVKTVTAAINAKND